MNAAAIFFLAVLSAQLLFTGVLIWIVARRLPARLKLYRFLAPAAVPILFCGVVIFGFLTWAHHRYTTGYSVDGTSFAVLLRIVVAYGVLWLIGVLFASAVIRWTRR